MCEYVELHCHSYFSLLDGSSSPEALVKRAVALGYPALAITDHNGLYGAVRFWQAAQEQGIDPILGAELTLVDGSHLVLLAETRRGYANLCRLISAAQLAGQKGEPKLTLDMLAQHTEGLLGLSACREGAIARCLLAQDPEGALTAASRLRDLFGVDRFWIELQRHYLPMDLRLVAGLVTLARRLEIGLVATNNVHYAERAGQRLHDVLTCIRCHTTLPEALTSGMLFPNSELRLRSPGEMTALFADLPEAVHNTLRIAERCKYRLDLSGQRLPAFPLPPEHTYPSYLRALCEEGLQNKIQPVTPQAQAQLDHELEVIEHLDLAGYFLVVWDIVRFARSKAIRCQGRGSAANSLVAYLLGITSVDPLQHHLLFERFLSEGTRTTPDIDMDFDADRREEVIQYVYERYGEEHVAMVCNVVTYCARSAVREVAKALSFPPDVIDRAAKALDTHSAARAAEQLQELAAEDSNPSHHSDGETSLRPENSEGPSLPWSILAGLLREIDGTPRHLSIHLGGMLITSGPLVEVVPIERATMPGRVVVQWNKDSVEDAGLIKIDLLSLRTLGMVEEALQHIQELRGMAVDLEHLPLDDPGIYGMLQKADAIGCFQVESRAQSQMLPRLRPRCFEDIIIEIALVRPGPIQGNAVNPYLQRRLGLEPVSYLHPSLETALAETLGVVLFQEQVMKVAMAAAGFSPAEADQLRRAMSRSRSEEAMAALRERFLAGARTTGIDADTAEQIFQKLAAFAGYGFCKSHAAAFALLAYQTLYLKLYFAPEFFCALLNHQPMGFYSPKVIQGDAERHGVPILPPDVNCSHEKCTLERCSGTLPRLSDGEARSRHLSGEAVGIRLGLEYVLGLGEVRREHIVQQRGERAYQSLEDFCLRTRLPKPLVENLIRAGAMDALLSTAGRSGGQQGRRDLLWQLGSLQYREEEMDMQVPVIQVALPALSHKEKLGWEYELLGLAPGDHVMRLWREELQKQGVLDSRQLAEQQDGQTVQVAGLVAVRQRPPTAKGFAFITLEDEYGLVNLIIRPAVYERDKRVLRNAMILWVRGQLQQEGHALSVLVQGARSLG